MTDTIFRAILLALCWISGVGGMLIAGIYWYDVQHKEGE